MKELLLKFGKMNKYGYIQGMNYIIGGIVFHCKNYSKSSKIARFIFINL